MSKKSEVKSGSIAVILFEVSSQRFPGFFKNTIKRLSVAVMATVLLFLANSANAAIITHNFQAVVNSAGSPFGVTANVNDTIFGSFTYDTTSSIINSGSTHAVYQQFITSGFSFVINGITITANNYGILVENGNTFDGFQVFAGKNTGIPGSQLLVDGVVQADASLYWYMLDDTMSVNSDTTLPGEVDLNSFSHLGNSSFNHNIGGGDRFRWDITEISKVTMVSAPSSTILFVLGLLCCGFNWRNRKLRHK